MPKVKIGREEIIDAALSLLREKGIQGVNARSVAKKIGCSTQPIFSNFSSMEALKDALIARGMEIYLGYLQNEMEEGKYPAYKASGMGYIRLAREEKQLFTLLFMRDRRAEGMSQEDASMQMIYTILQQTLGISLEQAKLFHLEMWVFVHGIASMIATGYLDWDEEMVSRVMTDIYQGLRMRFSENGGTV